MKKTKGKVKSIKAWVAIELETNEMFSTRHREGFREICLHPTKKDADKAGYGDEFWKIIPVLISPLTKS